MKYFTQKDKPSAIREALVELHRAFKQHPSPENEVELFNALGAVPEFPVASAATTRLRALQKRLGRELVDFQSDLENVLYSFVGGKSPNYDKRTQELEQGLILRGYLTPVRTLKPELMDDVTFLRWSCPARWSNKTLSSADQDRREKLLN